MVNQELVIIGGRHLFFSKGGTCDTASLFDHFLYGDDDRFRFTGLCTTEKGGCSYFVVKKSQDDDEISMTIIAPTFKRTHI